MPRFRIKVKNVHSEWWEDYIDNAVTDNGTARAWAEDTLRRFNEGEFAMYGDKGKPRSLLEVDFLGDGPLQHEWEKQNVFTCVGDGHRARDKYKCKRCGCEALRYGFSEAITRTGKWRAKKYEYCVASK